MIGCYTAADAIILSLIGANTAGSTKRSAVNAAFFVSYCIGNIIGPFAFKASEAPVYKSGIIAILVSNSCLIILLVPFALYARWQNKCKTALVSALGEREGVLDAFGDKTDRENVYFHYSY